MIQLAADFILVTGLMTVGRWLEDIGVKDGVVDRFFTPFPMGLFGLIVIAAERLASR